jgi:hypothetical protein
MKPDTNGKWYWAIAFIRSLLACNYLLLSTSFLPPFREFRSITPTLADQIFGGGNGFRPDFVFLFFSSILIFTALIVFTTELRARKSAKWDALTCLIWLLVFFFWTAVNLDMG